jgi:hypothetical protein
MGNDVVRMDETSNDNDDDQKDRERTSVFIRRRRRLLRIVYRRSILQTRRENGLFRL